MGPGYLGRGVHRHLLLVSWSYQLLVADVSLRDLLVRSENHLRSLSMNSRDLIRCLHAQVPSDLLIRNSDWINLLVQRLLELLRYKCLLAVWDLQTNWRLHGELLELVVGNHIRDIT